LKTKLITITILSLAFIAGINAQEDFADDCDPYHDWPLSPENHRERYSVSQGKVYYSDWDVTLDDINPYAILIKNADAATFKQLNSIYAKDKNKAYYITNEIIGVDPETFDLRKEFGFTHDKDHVFYLGKILEHSDSKTFEKINYYFYKDKNHVYTNHEHSHKILKGVNPRSFKTLHCHILISNGLIYWDEELLKDADPETFAPLIGEYYSDGKSLYYQYHKLEEGDPATFEHIIDKEYKSTDKYYKDKIHIYYEDKILSGANPADFRFPYKDYLISNNKVFYSGRELNNADGETFTHIQENYYKDKKHVYYAGHIIEKADPAHFRLIHDYLGCDKNFAFHELTNLGEVDGDTFTFLTWELFRDKDYLYERNGNNIRKKIKIDNASFSRLSGNYYKDNNHVIFHMGNIVEIIKDADPETFKPLHTTYPAAKDKNNFYIRNEKVNESDMQEYLAR